MTGRMVSKWPGKCLECEHDWRAGDMIFYNEGRVGYYCSESCARSALESQTPPYNGVITTQTGDGLCQTANVIGAQGTSNAGGIPPTYADPVGPSMYDKRQSAIDKAHSENIAASAELVRQLDHLTAAINKIAKWLIDDAMANRGLKL